MPRVEVDEDKYEVLAARAEEKGFEKTEDYIDHLLSQVVEKIGKEKHSGENRDNEEVKEKLRDLGYM